MLDVNDEFIANFYRMGPVADTLCFDNEFMRWQQEIHPGAGTSIAGCELFGAYISDPWPKLGMKQILNVILRFKGK
jgi:hypothetical protein